ncbi:MAG: tape measure protein [Candidatus Asgardarchaeia archaeon]
MADLGSLVVSFGADLTSLKQGVHQAEIQFQKFQKRGASALKRIQKNVFSLKSAIIGLSASMVARGLLDTAASFEKFETALTTITGSSKKAKTAMDWITEFTAKTPYELDHVTNAFTKLSAYGFDATKHLKIIGDTASAMGKSLAQAVEAFADAATGEFERLKEFGIKAKTEGDTVTLSWVENGQQMQKTMQKTQAIISKGLSEIWSNRFAGGMDKFASTWSGMWSNLKDQFTLFEKSVMDSGLFNYLKNVLKVVLDKINKLKAEGKLDEWAKKISDKIIGTFEAMAIGIAGFWDLAKPLLKNIKKGMTDIWDWYKELPEWIKKSGLILALFGGRSTKIVLGVLAVTSSKMKELKKQINEFQKEGGKGGFMAMLKAQEEKKRSHFQRFKITPIKTTPVEVNEEELSETQKRLQKFFKELRSMQHIAAETKIKPTAETKLGSEKEIIKSHDARLRKEYIQLMEEGKTLTESLLTPQEQYTKTIAHLNTLLDAGAISQETYNRALNKAEESIKGTVNGYEKLISEIEFEKSLIGKNETVQRAMTMARENDIKIGSEQYNQLLERISAYDAETERLANVKKAQEERLQIIQDFNVQYENLGKKQFEIERENLEEQVALWQKAGIDKERIARMTSKKLAQINLEETRSVMSMYADMAGGVAEVFQQIAQAGGKQSKEAFMMYKAFAVAQAGIQATSAILNTLASPLLTPPMNQIMAGVIGAMAAAKVAMIVSAQPPSYDEGGISKAKGFYQTGNIAEAHIPLKKGSIPVELKKQEEKTPVDVTILNAFDPAMIDEYMYSSQGQSAILNVIGNHSQTIRRVLR